LSDIKLLVILLINMLCIMPTLSQNNTIGSNNIMVDLLITSSEKKGYDVYLDNIYIGSDGQSGDELDGNYRLLVTGNMNHSIIADDEIYSYGLSNCYIPAGAPFIISIDSTNMNLGPSNKEQHIESPIQSYAAPQELAANQQFEPIKNDHPSTQLDSNVPPLIDSLTPDMQEPQQIGATINWRAQASDPEGDPIYYKFLIKGPGTGEKWETVQVWSSNNMYSWKTKEGDIGKSYISVQIRDGKHADTSSMDDMKNSTGYEINGEQLASLNIQVVNDVYTNEDRRIYYCQEGKYYYIRNRLSLTGPDLDKVAKVKYILPQSFPNPEQVSEDPSTNFETWILTWGRFNGIAIITTKSGQQFEIPYSISFKDKVERAKAQGITLIQNCEG
jgi:hypothetical protein